MSSDDDGYVHRPGAVEQGSQSGGGAPTAGETDESAVTGAESAAAPTETDGFGRRGWVLVAIVVLAVLVIPGVIYLYPATPGSADIPFLVAMLALPMVPAVLLGLTAVWSMTESSRSDN